MASCCPLGPTFQQAEGVERRLDHRKSKLQWEKQYQTQELKLVLPPLGKASGCPEDCGCMAQVQALAAYRERKQVWRVSAGLGHALISCSKGRVSTNDHVIRQGTYGWCSLVGSATHSSQ